MAKNKEKNHRSIVQNTFKNPPFFRMGALVFEEGGHRLVLSNGYYRCALNCQGKCDKHSRQIPKETLERAYCRYFQIYTIDSQEAERILKKAFRENLGEVLMGVDEEYTAEESVFDTTLAVMRQEHKSHSKIRKSDVKTAVDSLAKMHQAEYPTLLLGFMLGTLMALAKPERESELGRSLAFLTSRVYLSERGSICAIEFERWGWYIINLINKSIPNYLQKIQRHKISIYNQKEDGLLKLPVAQAALTFNMGNTAKAMNVTMEAAYQMIKIMRDAVQMAFDFKSPEEASNATFAVLDAIQKNPAIAVMIKLADAVDLKAKKQKKL